MKNELVQINCTFHFFDYNSSNFASLLLAECRVYVICSYEHKNIRFSHFPFPLLTSYTSSNFTFRSHFSLLTPSLLLSFFLSNIPRSPSRPPTITVPGFWVLRKP
uniref:Uncharacterized protein n=1 Tax=Palpitomonas bilix TaxID=652834 RepID=A0A7S3GH58_9EUKA|mmetsp:Transcript_4932/g.10499  ORF Transcript_4932/g.10499 Transcript_4932/m.10499 type:complete len:105 (+) Transcript_4932:867-1181(+)